MQVCYFAFIDNKFIGQKLFSTFIVFAMWHIFNSLLVFAACVLCVFISYCMLVVGFQLHVLLRLLFNCHVSVLIISGLRTVFVQTWPRPIFQLKKNLKSTVAVNQLKYGLFLRSGSEMCLCLWHNTVVGDYKNTFISGDCGVICNLDALLWNSPPSAANKC